MARKKRTGSGLRNLFLLALLVAVFALLAVGVRFLQDDPVYLTVSGPEELEALRTSEDNAFGGLMAAASEASTIRRAYRDDTEDIVLAFAYHRRAPGATESLFAEAWADPSHGIWRYGEEGAAIVHQAREALKKPHFFHPHPAGLLDTRIGDNRSLTLLLLIRGMWLLDQGAVEEGTACLLDGLRVAELLAPYDGYRMTHADMARRLLIEVYLWAVGRADADDLARIQDVFADARQYPDPCAMVQAQWRRLDDTLPGLVPISHDGVGMGRRVGMRFFNRQIQQSAAFMSEHRETLLSLCEDISPELSYFVHSERPHGRFNSGAAYVLNRFVEHVGAAALWGSQYEALLVGLALERHYRDTGAFAKSLDELVPAYLPEVPWDHADGAPLRYRLDDDGYRVYSIGSNGRDDGGHDRHDEILIRHPGTADTPALD